MADEIRAVAAADWAEAAAALHAAGIRWFDWLGAVDEIGREDAIRIMLRAAPEPDADGVRLETRVPRSGGTLASVRAVWAGAAWHEREVADFFGVAFAGGDPRPLLLRPGTAGHPLLRDAVLAARAVRPWPGAKEPGDVVAAGRRRMVPPGVPDPAIWGERTGSPAEPEEIAASVAGGRVRGRR
ncbi:NADH-quinone oxidoreductase subunit C [Propioniciclava soli]|uniref:NADH-quinone oxidoreductase subunit C n=1 Tax=Propioniciclava soli TaxID=2775081 RepID=A0ABZ3C9I9_9ACTN